jgi:hypothetical protein
MFWRSGAEELKMSRFVTRLFAAALITLGGVSLSAVTFDAQAARWPIS